MTANASVSSKLSQRARTLSTRRRNNIKARSEGHDLSGQDAPLHERDSWGPAGHKEGHEYDHEDEEDEDEDDNRNSILDSDGGINGEGRGRQHEPIAA